MRNIVHWLISVHLLICVLMTFTSLSLSARQIKRGDEVITVYVAPSTTAANVVQYGTISFLGDVTIPQ